MIPIEPRGEETSSNHSNACFSRDRAQLARPRLALRLVEIPADVSRRRYKYLFDAGARLDSLPHVIDCLSRPATPTLRRVARGYRAVAGCISHERIRLAADALVPIVDPMRLEITISHVPAADQRIAKPMERTVVQPL